VMLYLALLLDGLFAVSLAVCEMLQYQQHIGH
jgi:hypothetical protein